jgi:uncharacterized protein
VHFSNYIKRYPYKEKPGYHLLYSTRSAATVLLQDNLTGPLEGNALQPSELKTLQRLGILVADANQEKQSMYGYLDAMNSMSAHFNALVVMTLDCNLSCKYCYEGTMKGNHYMSRETADLVVDFIGKSLRPGKKSLNVDFYGGEPLLHTGRIRDISERLMRIAEKRGVSYSFTLVTNGTLLTRKTARELAGLGLKSVCITLDGPRDNHNAFRPYKSGTGSFDLIIRNIREVSGIVEVGIGGNFHKDNYEDFPGLLDYLLGEGLTPDNISHVKFAPISKTHSEFAPPDFNDGCASVNEPWLFEAGTFLREEILRRGFKAQRIIPSPCVIEIKDDIVANYDGTLYKCPGLIGKKEFIIGDLQSGIVDYRDSYNLDSWKNDDCIDCEYLPICFGGCRFMKLLRDGNIDGVDCKRPYLDSILETFVLQDLKYKTGIQNN